MQPVSDQRPDPDRLLAAVQAEEARARRGRLRIFFGASAGVGKTYAMLEAARMARAAGRDLVVGYVQPHGRIETERLTEGLEVLPTLPVRHRSLVRQEFDLDRALARRPGIVIVDELAHSNLVDGTPAPRHAKRWQDVEELLDAGIDVWTTVNVQHLDSLNDVVAGITGIRQNETVPDRILDEADDIELIDLPPDDLLARLKAGKVYVEDQVATAVERFFRIPNLIALRELALRRTADRVDAAARAYAEREPGARTMLARDRFLIGVGPGARGEELVRFGKRFADALDAEWTVVSVETPRQLRFGEAERNRRIEVLRLAESLGAETVTLGGPSAAEALLDYARLRKATRIVVGTATGRGWRRLLRVSTPDRLVRLSHDVDVSVIAARGAARAASVVERLHTPTPRPLPWPRYAWAAGMTALCSALAFAMHPYFELSNIVMMYLLGVTFAGLRLGRGPSALTAVLNVAAFDFFFVPPRFDFAVADVQYLVTFAVMLGVALVISGLTASVRQQTRVAGARERRTALLYGMSRELAATRGVANIARVAVRHVAEVFDGQVVVLLPDAHGRLRHPADAPLPGSLRAAELSVAQWVADHARAAGLGTDTLPAAPAIYLPLVATPDVVATPTPGGPPAAELRPATLGVLALRPANRRRVLLPEQRHLLETFASQIALALERVRLAESAEHARVAAETEGVRNTLLASISHDLRTPLAVIAGAGSTLAEHGDTLSPQRRVELARSIERKARDMSELVSNVLDLVRLESGHVALRRDWQTVDDLAGAALGRLEASLAGHVVEVSVPADLAPVYVDAALAVEVFVNLLENAAKYTPPGTHVWITGAVEGDFARVIVEDDGPGLPPGDPARLFDKFQRGRTESSVSGAGLGLTICRSIVVAHGGTIAAAARPGGGARFTFTLPLREAPA